ncbi:hypothetical protein BH23ACT9_BH23ACT9_30580 [soil metagenome]
MRRHLLRLAVLLTVAGLSATLLGGLAAVALDGLVRTGSHRIGYTSDDVVVVLAIGTDMGPPHRPGDPLRGRADGIHLFVLDTATDAMTVVDIPRDAAIGGTKVNAHLAFGGPERLVAAVQAWSGLPIDFHVLGSFQTVEAVTEALGGIQVDVPRRLLDPFSGSDLQPGPQVIGPQQALAFTRDRKSLPDGDIGRSRNQTLLMLAALQQVRATSADNLQYVVHVVATIQQHTTSNIPPGEVVPLALAALRVQPDAIEHITLTGPFGTIGGQSVINLQPGEVFVRLSEGQVGPAR